MSNFQSIKYPPIPTKATHFLLEDTYLYFGEEPPFADPGGNIEINPEFNTIKANTKIIVLEESVGFKSQWNKILVDDGNGNFDTTGYVVNKIISALVGTKPSLPISQLEMYQPNYGIGPDIDWRKEKVDTVLKDIKKGNYFVSFDTGLEKVDNSKLPGIVENAVLSSIQLILKEVGKKNDLEYAKSLQNNYYLCQIAIMFLKILLQKN